MLSLIHARTFLAVIEMGGFRPAARRLDLAVSTVAHHIDQLEADVSARLIVRQRGRVEATAQGNIFRPLAQALVDTAERAHELLSRAPLRVSAASNIGVYLLQPKIASFVEATGVIVEPWIGPNPDVAERLQGGLADVGLMEWWNARPGFEARPWRRERLVLIVSPAHPWAKRRSVKPEDLIGETILGGERGSGTATVLRTALGGLVERFATRAGYGSTEGVKRAVRAGHGISIVLGCAVEDEVAEGCLIAIPLRGVKLEKQLSIVLPHGLHEAALAERFTDHILGI